MKNIVAQRIQMEVAHPSPIYPIISEKIKSHVGDALLIIKGHPTRYDNKIR
jgi:hypothetical protein